jgi:predicted DNA-binding protein (MmcQ/YjbR family)
MTALHFKMCRRSKKPPHFADQQWLPVLARRSVIRAKVEHFLSRSHEAIQHAFFAGFFEVDGEFVAID